jgi:histone H2B
MPPKASGKAAAKSGKATKAIAKGDKKKRKGKRKESYAIYIYKVSIWYLLHSFSSPPCRC